MTYRVADAQIKVIDPEDAGIEADPLIQDMTQFLSTAKCISEWDLRDFSDRVEKMFAELKSDYHVLYTEWSKPGPAGINNRQLSQGSSNIFRRRHKLDVLLDALTALPRCNYFIGDPPGRYKRQDEERQEIGKRDRPIAGPRTEAAGFAGFYLGGNVAGNFNTLGQTETFKMTNVVTNQFSDSSRAVSGGFGAGFLISPWNNNILVGSSASIDFLRQDTIHTFPPSPFFLGQTTNVIGTLNGQIGVVARPGLFLYGEFGLAVVNVDQKLNFSGPVTSVNQNVTGANVGVGFAFQPANWQVAGIPVAVTGQYNHVFLPGATFDNPGSPFFLYRNQNDIDRITIGLRAYIDPDAGKRLWRAYH